MGAFSRLPFCGGSGVPSGRKGRARLHQAKAAEELAELSRQVDDKARAQAEAYAAELENKKAALRAKAGGKLDQAAALVVERIVNS